MSTMHTFEGRPLTSIDSENVELPAVEAEKKPTTSPPANTTRLLELFKAALGDRVKEVRESKRLTDSPCCLVNADGNMSSQMQRLMKMANQEFIPASRILEINPSAP